MSAFNNNNNLTAGADSEYSDIFQMSDETDRKNVSGLKLNYRPVYFLCEESEKFCGKKSLAEFFRRRFQRLMKRIAHQPIFLSEKAARQYGKYISGQVWLLKAYVPESAIQGQGSSQEFIIKSSCLNQMRVHGGYPTWLGLKERYVENPEFEYAVYNRDFV